MAIICVFSFIVCSYLLQLCSAATLGKCPPSFYCGSLGHIHFPFTNTERPDCGLLEIHNCEDRYPGAIKTIKNNGKWFHVTMIDKSTIFVKDNDLSDRLLSRWCGVFSQNSNFIADSPFFNASMKHSVILFTCKRTLHLSPHLNFSKSTICHNVDIFYKLYEDSITQDFFTIYSYNYYSESCSMVQLPISGKGVRPNATVDLFRLVSDYVTIEVQVTSECSSCYHQNGGQCQLDNNGKFFCAQAGQAKCPPSFHCGNLGNIGFPFTKTERPDCGLLAIHNCEDREPDAIKTIKINEKWFYVTEVINSTISVRDNDLRCLSISRSCGAFSKNSTLPKFPFFSAYIKPSVILFICNRSLNLIPPLSFSKSKICPDVDIFYKLYENSIPGDFVSTYYYYNYYSERCSMVQLPTSDKGLRPNATVDLFQLVSDNMTIQVQVTSECSSCYHQKGGQCQLDNNRKFFCALEKTRKNLLVLTVASVAGSLGVLMILAFCLRRYFCKKENPTDQIIETFLKQHGRLAAKRYSYLEVKKITNSFRNKLGQGGYGSVFKGKLQDGSLVAVKVLSNLKGNGEEFINEVATISMTSHVNIVSHLGFCLEGSKQALIYEYMPNGSVEKFICEEKDNSKLNLQLNCKVTYNIAIGVARGLEYLHRGCSIRILHFDIKPHNILLDEDFCPKISDFGLAKICPEKESTKTLLDARGTVGYIAPEFFLRCFGRVSHKSDVYSYGMMVLEMIGARQNNNVQVDNSSDIYFPNWIYKCFQMNQDLGLRCIKNENDNEMVKKMILVSFWCIQTDPSNRPAMSRVVEMIEGNLESLPVPPKPNFLSSSASPQLYSTETSETV